MGLHNNYSDYGSGSSSSSWMSQQDIRWPTHHPMNTTDRPTQKSASYSDLVMGRCTLEDVMREFQMNGSDSPYNPDEDRLWGKQTARSGKGELSLSGLGPSCAYVRQKSWPAPERSPAPRLHLPVQPQDFATSTPILNEAPAFVPAVPPFSPAAPAFAPAAPAASPLYLTAEQSRVLRSVPAAVLQSLLKQFQNEKRNKVFQECRFCKNNGERESYYRSHVLKDAGGRVACPVLRAFTCARCGARGDAAHTIKYCPLSTNEERIKSAAMMRSVRMASGRRRANSTLAPSPAGVADYVVFGEPTPSLVYDNNVYANYAGAEAPLDPQWAALEQKLML